MKIRPLHDRVIVRREEEEQKTAGGILLPGSAQEQPNQGEVVAVGSGRILDNGDVRPIDVKVGDTVLYSKYGGTEVSFGGDDLLILTSRDVLAIVAK